MAHAFQAHTATTTATERAKMIYACLALLLRIISGKR
jgi:hypothetical protein